MRFKGAFQYEMQVDPELETAAIQIPPMLVQPFLENAIIHGMRGKKGDGLIQVSFATWEVNGLRITVTDNGPGLQATENAASKTHQSYGSDLAKRRLAMLTAYRNASIVMENQPTGGTSVVVTIPSV
mgnify:CR=1 FL=1